MLIAQESPPSKEVAFLIDWCRRAGITVREFQERGLRLVPCDTIEPDEEGFVVVASDPDDRDEKDLLASWSDAESDQALLKIMGEVTT